MDIRQFQYILTIAEEQNITRAAEKLYITRSALNYSLLNTEKQLGFPIFKRLSNRLIPTYAGQVYLSHVERILAGYREMQHSIKAVSDATNQRIGLGITIGNGQRIFQRVFPVFHREYPNITFHLLEDTVQILETRLLEGNIDLAFFGGVSADPQHIDCHIIGSAGSLVLAMRRDNPLIQKYALDPNSNTPVDLKLFAEEYFIGMHPSNALSKNIKTLFSAAGFTPKIMMECTLVNMIADFISQGAGLGFLPTDTIVDYPELAGFYVAPVQTLPATTFFRKGTRFTEPERELLRMVSDEYRLGQKYRP